MCGISGEGEREGGLGGRMPWARRASLLDVSTYHLFGQWEDGNVQFGIFVRVDHDDVQVEKNESRGEGLT